MALNSSAFAHLRAAVEALIAQDVYPDGDATDYALELWTVAHGIAALLISRPYLPWGDVEAFADRVLRSAVVGQIMSGVIGVGVSPRDGIAMLKGMLDEHQHR
jgi:hypothetical protein